MLIMKEVLSYKWKGSVMQRCVSPLIYLLKESSDDTAELRYEKWGKSSLLSNQTATEASQPLDGLGSHATLKLADDA